MTSFSIERLPFDQRNVENWRQTEPRFSNWPVVYVLDDGERVYVGETRNAAARMRQHLDSDERKSLRFVRVVLDETFNKSVCLDLESFLIRLFAGDGKLTVLNRNEGIVNSDYYDRSSYQDRFDAIFEALREQKLFTRDIRAIENTELFKLSPFKALNQDQAVAMEGILDSLFEDLETGVGSTIVVEGEPGTGKTVVAVYLMKLLGDIERNVDTEDIDGDSLFSDYFQEGYAERLEGFRMGIVVPQQALRASLKKVFARTPGLDVGMVLTPFEVGMSDEAWDLLLVDETHRLNHRANQASAMQNRRFGEINERLFGADGNEYTQLDWIRARSTHQMFLLDADQTVRPTDLPAPVVRALTTNAGDQHRLHRLASQMRVRAGSDYIAYVRSLLRGEQPEQRDLRDYEFRIFDDLGEMHDAIRARDEEHGLSRLVAGYAWPWKSKNHPDLFDIEIDGRQLQWNRTQKDWINSPGAIDQVGSIHTVQGYDLNYVGAIIGPDLRLDPATGQMVFDRSHYFDKKGMENNPRLGVSYSDDDLLRYVQNVYAVLLTRAVRGTFVYISDPALRTHFPSRSAG